ncbi:MAG: hypothetical protein ACXW4B_10865 [Micavibrio sp.]
MKILNAIFNRLNGRLLEFAAENDIVPLAKFSFGRTNMAENSKALATAAENKSYGVLSHLLNDAAIIPGPTDFRFGKDWDRFEEIAKTDQKVGDAYKRYQKNSSAALDDVFGPKPNEPSL